MWNRIKRFLGWSWKGIKIWSTLSALGATSILRAVLQSVVYQWTWHNQLFLFGGVFVFILGVAALFSPLIEERLGVTAKVKSIPITTVKARKPSRLEHDGVLWEDGGRRGMWGIIDVIGPLCPDDFAPLCSECRDKVQSDIDCSKLVSDSEYHLRLFCPECRKKYILGENPKTTGASLDEVRSRFEGKRKREQEV